jgi:hypothetical protein
LGAGLTTTPVRAGVRVPAFVLPGNYFLGAVVDFDGQVGESNEGNNTRTVPVSVTAPACPLALELRDPMLYPKDDVVVRMSAPVPFTLPTLTSRCTPAESYLIVWGCSGRVPGTPIGGFLLPLNIDACTNVSLSWVGPFVSFIGSLDAGGIARANFTLLRVPYVGDLDTDLAALVFSRTTLRVLGVSNAVRVALRQ